MTLREQVLAFLRRERLPLLVASDDDRAATLLEPATGKSFHLVWGELAQLEEKRSPQRPAPYLALRFGDGRQLALADVGFAFAPDPRNSGPLPELPQAMSFGDFRHLLSIIESLRLHKDRQGEVGRLFLLLLALVDGARAVGFEISSEEKQLERLLAELEADAGSR